MTQWQTEYRNEATVRDRTDTKVTFVGHATVRIEMDGVTLLTDPLLRDRVWHLRREVPREPNARVPVEDLTAVLVSHLHPDHADTASLRRIPPDVPVIAPHGTGGYLRTRLPHPVETIEIDQRLQFQQVEVIAVKAAHSGPGPAFAPISACAGYVIRGSKTIYFAGDTALFPEMADLGDAFDIDLALLPVWGYGPNLRGDHMTPFEAAQALQMLRPSVAVPIHWGTFRPPGKVWSQMNFFSDPPFTFAGYAPHLAPDATVRILEPGESLIL